jgi:hypothetical protein
VPKENEYEEDGDPAGLAPLEEFIVEIEGARKNCDVTRWGQFTDIKGHQHIFRLFSVL